MNMLTKALFSVAKSNNIEKCIQSYVMNICQCKIFQKEEVVLRSFAGTFFRFRVTTQVAHCSGIELQKNAKLR